MEQARHAMPAKYRSRICTMSMIMLLYDYRIYSCSLSMYGFTRGSVRGAGARDREPARQAGRRHSHSRTWCMSRRVANALGTTA